MIHVRPLSESDGPSTGTHEIPIAHEFELEVRLHARRTAHSPS